MIYLKASRWIGQRPLQNSATHKLPDMAVSLTPIMVRRRLYRQTVRISQQGIRRSLMRQLQPVFKIHL